MNRNKCYTLCCNSLQHNYIVTHCSTLFIVIFIVVDCRWLLTMFIGIVIIRHYFCNPFEILFIAVVV